MGARGLRDVGDGPLGVLMTMRVEIIAEIANAHQGDPAAADSLALAAAKAGADAVKFQVYFAEELLVERHPRFSHFQRQAFTPEMWRRLIASARTTGARVYCDVFGLRALEVAAAAGADGFKIHSSDLGNEPLLEAAAAHGRPLFLAVGGSTASEIARAVAIVTRGGVRPVLLHGFQSYPTAAADAHLERLEWLRKIFGATCEVGFADHTDADDPLAMALPLLAIGLGARVIEKHLTADRAAKGTDYYSSLNPEEFSAFVAMIRKAERAVDEEPEAFSEAERRYRRQVKKHWVTTHPLREGERLRREDLVMKRAESDAEVPDLEQLAGRPVLRSLPAEHVVSRADVPQRVCALVVARMRSCRLPGKALLDVAGMPALGHLLERLKQARRVHRIVLCTTGEPDDEPIAALGARAGVRVFRGSSEDVLARMLGALEGEPVDVALRVTGDDLLVDPEYADRAIDHHFRMNAQYTDLKALPSGTEVEVFDVELLRTLAKTAKDSRGTEYLTSYVQRHRDQLRTASAPVEPRHAHPWRLTLDTAEDLQVIRQFLTAMRQQGKALSYRLDDIVGYCSAHPEVLSVNAKVRQRTTPPEVDVGLDWRRLRDPEPAAARPNP